MATPSRWTRIQARFERALRRSGAATGGTSMPTRSSAARQALRAATAAAAKAVAVTGAAAGATSAAAGVVAAATAAVVAFEARGGSAYGIAATTVVDAPGARSTVQRAAAVASPVVSSTL